MLDYFYNEFSKSNKLFSSQMENSPVQEWDLKINFSDLIRFPLKDVFYYITKNSGRAFTLVKL